MMRLERCSTNALRDGQGVDRSGYHRSVYIASDVDALLARIRAAVDAERGAVDELIGRAVFPPEGLESYRLDKAARIGVRRAWRALDALLTGGDA